MKIQYNEIKNLMQNAEDIRTSFLNFTTKQRETFSATISNISALELARNIGNIEAEVTHEMAVINQKLVSIFGFLNTQLENYLTIARDARIAMESLSNKINAAYQASANATAGLGDGLVSVDFGTSLADAYKQSQAVK